MGMIEAIVAGHICLDIIPEMHGEVTFTPGKLIEAGAATISTGGAVSNTGITLTKLGIATKLIGRIGNDPFGRIVKEILEGHQAGLGQAMSVCEGAGTSYTLVVNLSGHDRMFIHAPGCNDLFDSNDLPIEELKGARLFHFGYPPLMAKMFADEGRELEKVFARAKEAGLITSLDTSLPDPKAPSGKADWREILERVLPYVDIFLPSSDELGYMLRMPSEGIDDCRAMAKVALQLGAKMVGIKAGGSGFYLRTSEGLGWLGKDWEERELWSPCFKVEVAGTTGSGDATIGGFLMALLRGFGPLESVSAATAVGACCCEAPDSVSGVQSWSATQTRIQANWTRLPINLGPAWAIAKEGVYERSQP